ncbi:hypothetical protein F4604DRAFT_1680109 [Suillus subluteus]|nr:hypothetical protein F4604DRAFT_1680109 [Suillus subluteus]
MSPLPSNHVLLGQAITHFDDVEAISTLNHSVYSGSQYPTRHSCTDHPLKRDPFHRQSHQAHPKEESLRCSNGAMQFLQQHLSFRKTAPDHEPLVAEVAAGRKFTRIAAAKFPEYIKVDDTRSPLRQQLAMSQDMAHDHPSSESSDVDSLPDTEDASAMALGEGGPTPGWHDESRSWWDSLSQLV